MKEEKLFNKIRDFLSYEKYYYDKKRGAFILEDRPKENTYIFSCSCDDLGFYVVYMEKRENKTHTFLKNTKEYERLSMYFNRIKETYFDKLIPRLYTVLVKPNELQLTERINAIEKLKGEILNKQVNKQQQGAEMKEEREQEKELIVKNAFEFLKRDDLIIINNSITYPFLSEKSLEEYEVYELFYGKASFFSENKTINIKYKSNSFGLSVMHISNDPYLKNLFDRKYNSLKAKQEQAEQPQDDYYLRKHDRGKPKLLQVPVEAIQAISEIMDYGSNKYGANTWQGVEIERYINAGLRHIYASQKDIGAKDKESGKEHLKHALCNLAYAVALYEMGKADEK